MSQSPLSYIKTSPFLSLAYLVQRLTGEFAPQLREWNLTPAMFLMLGFVNFQPGVSAADVARTCSMSPQHVAAMITQAERRGWITRDNPRGRGHRSPLHATDAARLILSHTWPLAQQLASPATLGLPQRDYDALSHLLQRAIEPRPDDASDVVVLLDDAYRPCGMAPRLTVHTDATPLHAAFSTYLFDADGALLLTRRALGKTTWPGVWTNSACGHLLPGETPLDAAQRRVPQELGTAPVQLSVVLPEFRYQALDASGIRENEFCPVMVGTIDREHVRPDPDEVAEWTWVDVDALVGLVTSAPALLSPWCVEQVRQLTQLPQWIPQR